MTTKRRAGLVLRWTAAFAALALFASALAAETIFLVNDLAASGPTLVRRTADDDTVTPIGPLDRRLTGLAFDRAGTLWGIEPDGATIVQLSRDDATTLDVWPLVWTATPDLIDLTVDREGSFWALDRSALPGRRSIFRLVPATGLTELVLDVDASTFLLVALAADAQGLLAVSLDAVFRVDLVDGDLDQLGDLGTPSPIITLGAGDVRSDGSLMTIHQTFVGPTVFSALAVFDPFDPVVTLLPGSYGINELLPSALALDRGAAPPIPTLGPAGIAALALLLAVLAMVRLAAHRRSS